MSLFHNPQRKPFEINTPWGRRPIEKINLSTPYSYKTQRENRRRPHSSCNTTAMVVALEIVGFDKYLSIPGERLADTLTRFFEGPSGYELKRRLAPTSQLPPQQIHAVLEEGINSLLRQPVIQFSTAWGVDSFIQDLRNGLPVVLSGNFPLLDSSGRWIEIGHIVTLVGFTRWSDGTFTWTIDDPYGDPNTGYKNQNGNDIIVSEENFNKWIKGGPTKWGHRFLLKAV